MNESDGYYYYADQDDSGGLVATNILVGSSDPSSFGLQPGYAVSFEFYQRQKEFYNLNLDESLNGRDAPSTGTVSQINVFIRFADDPEFSQPRSYYDAVFQTDNDEPSLKHYFWEVSYNNLLVNTYHYPGTLGGVTQHTSINLTGVITNHIQEQIQMDTKTLTKEPSENTLY